MQNTAGKTALGLDSNIGALLCYVNICLPIGFVYSIIVLVTDKENKLPRFHAFQSLILTVVSIVIFVGLQIFATVIAIAANSTIISLLFTLVFAALGIGIFALIVISAIKAFQGNIFKIPVIGDMADKWSN